MTPVKRLALPEQAASQAELGVNSIQETTYQHAEVIDVDRGKYDCDCNGFVRFVLNRSAPAHYGMIPQRVAGIESIFSRMSFEGISSPGGFLKSCPTRTLVHVLIAAKAPTQNIDGTFSLRIYDSAALSHFGTRLD